MHGSTRCPRDSSIKTSLFFFSALLLVSGGCGGSKEVLQNVPPKETLADFLAKYEPSFNPSDYDAEISPVGAQEQLHQAEDLAVATMATISQPETIPGFRVQVLSTTDIDQANRIKDSLASRLQDDWVYLAYDAPYYKVRVGNFSDRSAANQMLKSLIRNGFADSWIVPDNILKNPPPKPPDGVIEAENPLERRRQ